MHHSDRPASVMIQVSPDELTWIHNALNEICNGIAIADFEFQARLGTTRSEMQGLLARIGRPAA